MKITNKIQRYIELARQKAWESNFHKKHGAVLVKGGSVINAQCNDASFSKFAGRFRKQSLQATRHAEIKAVLGVSRKNTEGASVYVVRINNHGDLMYSKPCDMCISVMEFCGIRKVIYSVNENKIGQVRIK